MPWRVTLGQTRSVVSAVLRYGLAVLSVATAIGLALPLERSERAPFVAPILCAVVASAWFGGRGPGWLAVLLAIASGKYFFIAPLYSLAVGTEVLPRFLVFAVSAVLAHTLTTGRRRAEQSLRQARDELEVRVEARTADLRRANEALRAEIRQRQHAEDALRILVEVTTAASDTASVADLASACLKKICELRQWSLGQVWFPRPDTAALVCSRESFFSESHGGALRAVSLAAPVARGQDLVGRVWESKKAAWITDVTTVSDFPRGKAARAEGLISGFVFPITAGDEVLAVFEFFSRSMREPDEPLLAAVETLGQRLGDILERRHAEDRLRRSEAYLAEAQRLSHTGSWARNEYTGEAVWSRELFQIFGYDPATTGPPGRAQLSRERVHPDDRALYDEMTERRHAEQKDYEFDYRIVLPDGAIRHIHSLGHPVFDESGNLAEFLGMAMDVTERKQAEEQLREGARTLRLTTETIPHLIWSARPDGYIDYCNQRLLDFTGMTMAEIRSLSGVFHHPDDVESRSKMWRVALTTGQPYELECRIRSADGSYRWTVSRATALRDEDNRIVRWYGTLTDIEDRRRAEETLRQAQADLAHITRVTTMGELTASLAHELNQPLTAVVTSGGSSLRWLAHEPPRLDKAADAVRRMIRDASRASEVIAHTRALLKKSSEEKAPFDITEVIRDVLILVQSAMARHGIRQHGSLPPGLPLVLGDRVQLQQVVLNLVMNGIEAMAEISDRGRELSVRAQRHQLDDGPGVLVSVEDTGPGLPPESLDRVFEAFYTTKAKGLGMGLSISRSIVEAHGGRLWVSVNNGPGLTFQFVVPTPDPPSP
jgi:PAS domain S-box-containing protein